MMQYQYDAIVIGAGHNGLTTATYLAMGGLKVCVLEQRPVVGGAAISEEFHPGYRNSVASYVVSLLREEVVEELELRKFGYQTMPLPNAFYPDLNGEYLLLTEDEIQNKGQYAKFSDSDHDAVTAFDEVVEKVGAIIGSQWLKEPPRLYQGGISDLIAASKLGLDLYHLDNATRHSLLQFFVGAPESIIESWFDSNKVKAMIASHCMPGNYASLSQPGAGLAMLHHAVGSLDGKKGAWGLVRGGMGTITQAMARSALAKGVEIKTEAPVEKILLQDGSANGVRLRDGSSLHARIIAANTDPKRTFLSLLGKEFLPEKFARDISAFRQESASLRMNLALSGLPQFRCMPGNSMGPQHQSTIVFIQSKAHLEEAYLSSRAGIPADPPIIEAIIPSTLDDTLTDAPGTHVMSLLCKYMPYDLKDGKHWDTEKATVVTNILEYLTRFIPNLPDILVAHQCLSPLDIERMFGMTRGDICHGRLEPDQLFSARPHPDAAQYATPVKGLYMCGSGAHPGGGVTGAPGRNAAQRILRDVKQKRLAS